MTKRATILVVLVSLFAIALPLHADFSSIANAIDGHGGVKQVWIPFMSVARAFIWMAHPKGVHDFQLATFEGAGKIDAQELQQILQSKAGPGFKPLVKVWSRRSKEWSFIYAKPMPETGRMELLILNHDRSDTVLVRVEVDGNALAAELRRPRDVKRIAEQ